VLTKLHGDFLWRVYTISSFLTEFTHISSFLTEFTQLLYTADEIVRLSARQTLCIVLRCVTFDSLVCLWWIVMCYSMHRFCLRLDRVHVWRLYWKVTQATSIVLNSAHTTRLQWCLLQTTEHSEWDYTRCDSFSYKLLIYIKKYYFAYIGVQPAFCI